ncbi:hypothetical protein ACVWZB_004838 [Paenibacillus polymyxa]
MNDKVMDDLIYKFGYYLFAPIKKIYIWTSTLLIVLSLSVMFYRMYKVGGPFEFISHFLFFSLSFILSSFLFLIIRRKRIHGYHRLIDVLYCLEESMQTLANVIRSAWLRFYKNRRAFSFVFLIYILDATGAAYKILSWFPQLKVADQAVIVFHDLSNFLVFIVKLLLVFLIVYSICFECGRKYITQDGLLMEELLIKLQALDIEIPYKHEQGICKLDADKLLDQLVQKKNDYLYNLIQRSYRIIDRTQFFPMGKPQTVIQKFETFIKKGSGSVIVYNNTISKKGKV